MPFVQAYSVMGRTRATFFSFTLRRVGNYVARQLLLYLFTFFKSVQCVRYVYSKVFVKFNSFNDSITKGVGKLRWVLFQRRV